MNSNQKTIRGPPFGPFLKEESSQKGGRRVKPRPSRRGKMLSYFFSSSSRQISRFGVENNFFKKKISKNILSPRPCYKGENVVVLFFFKFSPDLKISSRKLEKKFFFPKNIPSPSYKGKIVVVLFFFEFLPDLEISSRKLFFFF